MTGFTPPYPPPLKRKPGLFRRLILVRDSILAVFAERSYTMKMGEVWVPFRKVFVACEPSLVREILLDPKRRFAKSRLMGWMTGPLLGNGIFVSNGEVWRRRRAIMDIAFENARLQKVMPLMCAAIDAMEARLADHQDGAVCDIDHETMHVTADIIFRTIFSETFQEADAADIYRSFLDFQRISYAENMIGISIIPARLSPRWRAANKAARLIRSKLEAAMQRRFDARAAGAKAPEDILSAMLEARDPVTDTGLEFDEAVDEVAVMFFAGHETTASALAWAFYCLANCPDIQQRAHDEAVQVLDGRKPEFSDVRRLKFIRNVFRETLRLYPPIAFLARDVRATETLRNKKVTPNDILMVAPYLTHRNVNLWSCPHMFDPDRFERDDSEDAIRNAYMPFSMGPRVCLGSAFALQEAALILAIALRRFRFEPIPGEVPRPVARLTLRSANGVKLRIHHRQ